LTQLPSLSKSALQKVILGVSEEEQGSKSSGSPPTSGGARDVCRYPLSLVVTRKTKELDHEKLVTVFLGPLSDRHWLYHIYMEIVARRTKATDTTDLYIFISDGKHVFDCSVEQLDHSVEQRLSLAYRGDLS
jgi:hypothetical protein